MTSVGAGRCRRLIPLLAVLLAAIALSPGVAGAESSIAARLRELRVTPVAAGPPRSFVLPALDDRRVTLGQLTGRAVLLYFWASW